MRDSWLFWEVLEGLNVNIFLGLEKDLRDLNQTDLNQINLGSAIHIPVWLAPDNFYSKLLFPINNFIGLFVKIKQRDIKSLAWFQAQQIFKIITKHDEKDTEKEVKQKMCQKDTDYLQGVGGKGWKEEKNGNSQQG